MVASAGSLEQLSFDRAPASLSWLSSSERQAAGPRRGERRCAARGQFLVSECGVARSIKATSAVTISKMSQPQAGAVLPGADAFGVSTVDLPVDDDARAISAAGFGNHRISPYHAASMMAMIARGGRWGVQRPAGVPDQALSPKLARKLGQMMVATTKTGTARKTLGRIRGVDIAGKTGSLIVDGLDYSWFAGFAPADDPRIAFAAVVVNDPQKVWHIRGTHLAKAAAKGALFGDTPPRAKAMVAMR